MLARRRTMNPQAIPLQKRIAEGSRLRQELKTAQARGEKAEAARIHAELDTFNANHGYDSGHGSGSEAESGSRNGTPGLPKTSSSNSLGGGLRAGGGLVRTPSTGSIGAEGSVLEEISKRNRMLNQGDVRRIQMADAERRRKAHLERIKAEQEAKVKT